jgi:ketosteroid isomerase-like protein
MNANEQLITRFYTAFRQKDYRTMQELYGPGAVFNDAVFTNLNEHEVRAMWQMLITKGKDMELTFSNVKATEYTGSAEWTAVYTFSSTGRKVTNRIAATFEFNNGKIIRHTDRFDFYTWAKQALGTTGLLLGWTGFLRNKIRSTARQNLDAWMKQQA